MIFSATKVSLRQVLALPCEGQSLCTVQMIFPLFDGVSPYGGGEGCIGNHSNAAYGINELLEACEVDDGTVGHRYVI